MGHVLTSMGLGQFNKVQYHSQRLCIAKEVDSDNKEGLVVRRTPHINGEAEAAFVSLMVA